MQELCLVGVSNRLDYQFLCNHSNLEQIVKNPACAYTLLDLIFTNLSCFYNTPEIFPGITLSDHNSIITCPSITAKKIKLKRCQEELWNQVSRPALENAFQVQIGSFWKCCPTVRKNQLLLMSYYFSLLIGSSHYRDISNTRQINLGHSWIKDSHRTKTARPKDPTTPSSKGKIKTAII